MKSWMGCGSKIRRKGLSEVQKHREAAALRCDREERERGAAAERHSEENSAPLSPREGLVKGWVLSLRSQVTYKVAVCLKGVNQERVKPIHIAFDNL